MAYLKKEEYATEIICGLQKPKYLLPYHLQKQFADPNSTKLPTIINFLVVYSHFCKHSSLLIVI